MICKIYVNLSTNMFMKNVEVFQKNNYALQKLTYSLIFTKVRFDTYHLTTSGPKHFKVMTFSLI